MMKTLMRSLYSVAASYALLALLSADAWSQTTCDLVLSLADLAAPGELVDLKTDVSDSDCTTQVTVQVDNVTPGVTKVDFKIDRSCISTGQAQFTGIALEVAGSPPTTSCNIDYNNPLDPVTISEDTVIDDFVPELQQLIVDAADATAMQFPAGNPTADALVALLDGPPATITPSSARRGMPFTITDPLGRIQASDFVVFFEPGTEPVDGYIAHDVNVSIDGTELAGRVPIVDTSGVDMTYLVRVTPDFSTLRFADLDFFVDSGPTCPPNCGF